MRDDGAPEGYETWQAYWDSRGESWRLEPEISAERQAELGERLQSSPSAAHFYPFHGLALSRADVEWLLHEHGPVHWNDPAQRSRVGLDVRGADLRRANLSGLPLARLRAGLTEDEWLAAESAEQREASRTNMEHANLRHAQLQGAIFDRARLMGANLGLVDASDCSLFDAELQDADLYQAHLERANLHGAHLEDARLHQISARDVDLRVAYFAKGTRLVKADLDSAAFDQVSFGNVNLSVVRWNVIHTLGDEKIAEERHTRPKIKISSTGTVIDSPPRRKTRAQRADDYEVAARAYRTLSLALRAQGLSRPAMQYHYRSEIMDRKVRFYRALFIAWALSFALGALTGYGDKLRRLLTTYIALVLGFAAVYVLLAQLPFNPTVAFDAVILSLTALHGRGLSPHGLPYNDNMAALAGAEAVCGVVVEALFVAGLIRRVTRS